jgi:hypothetical protein
MSRVRSLSAFALACVLAVGLYGCPALVQTAGRELVALQRDARILHASATGRRDVANPSPLAERAWE